MPPYPIASKEDEPAPGGEDYGDNDEDNLFSLGSLAASKLQKLYQPDDYGFEAYLNFPMEMEKQISVDPASLKGLTKVNNHHHNKPKFISASLPCSASSSPRSDSALIKSMMKWRGPNQQSLLARQRSAALPRSALQQRTTLRKSKSCAEGRSCSPSDEFDILSRRFSFQQQPSENGVQVLYECKDDTRDSNKDQEEEEEEEAESHDKEESFKCGALCLFLPGLSKKKPSMPSIKEAREDQLSVASRIVSLEKFECGSWCSSPVLGVDGHGESVRSYFDLPLELIRSSANDANSPVNAAFVFDKDRKGVLKKSSSRSAAPRKSHESSNRHVRFSTSAPTSYPPSPTSACITPRLLKAREDFNAFLEAQSV
ncbi:hypothetical protein J5N97_011164 [Dioscorea zingiberensis]|uniref:Uncharacterized protein n=1 Tax=Dioscorea zingiberensis TaxID=325984 RepID=A0A9D5HN90_9LILI|nr:hypothetical protein J5N97_011164 [Dioscorea zingiberensis]